MRRGVLRAGSRVRVVVGRYQGEVCEVVECARGLRPLLVETPGGRMWFRLDEVVTMPNAG